MRLLSVALKDFRITVRDRQALLTLLVMPFVIISILGMALGPVFSGDSKLQRIDVALVDDDHGSVAVSLKEALTGKELKDLLAVKSMSKSKATVGLRRGDLAAAIIIPKDFSKKIRAGKRSHIELLTDPGQELNGSIVRSVVSSISANLSSFQAVIKTSVTYFRKHRLFLPKETKKDRLRKFIDDLVTRVRDASETKRVGVVAAKTKAQGKVTAIQYYSAGMAVMFVLFSAMFGAFSLITERERSTLARLLSTPASRLSILGGKLMGTFFVGVLQFAVLVLSTRLVFGVSWGRAWWAIITLVLFVVFAATGMSIFIATLARTARSASGIAQLMIQSMSALGGSMIPISVFPAWMTPISNLTINAWAMRGFIRLMDGGDLAAVIPSIQALAVIGTVFFMFGIWRLRYE